MLRLIPKLTLHFHVVSHDRASRKMFSVMLNKTKKTSFPWRHPCTCSPIDHLWKWQQPIAALVAFTSLYTYGWSNGHWELGTRKLLFGGHSGKLTLFRLTKCSMPNCQFPMPKATFIESAICIFSYIRTQWPGCFKQSDWFAISDVIFAALQGAVTGKLKQNNSADVKAVFC